MPEGTPREAGPLHELWFGDVLVVFVPLFAACLVLILVIRGPHMTLLMTIASAAAMSGLVTAAFFLGMWAFVRAGRVTKPDDE
jgi:hypothetical protein